jgi:hypothetical protein
VFDLPEETHQSGKHSVLLDVQEWGRSPFKRGQNQPFGVKVSQFT